MAGRARAKALADELSRRARALFGVEEGEPTPTSLEYVCYEVESPKTLKTIAHELSASLGFDVDYGMLMRHLRAEHGETATDEALDAARARASHCLAEASVDIVDEPAETSFEVSRAASRSRSRQWLAQAWNPARYGQQKGVSVSISVGSLHLDALRAPTARATAIVTPSPVPALPSTALGDEEIAQVVE